MLFRDLIVKSYAERVMEGVVDVPKYIPITISRAIAKGVFSFVNASCHLPTPLRHE